VARMIDTRKGGHRGRAFSSAVQGKSVVNSISMKAGDADVLHQAHLIRRYGGAPVVVMRFD